MTTDVYGHLLRTRPSVDVLDAIMAEADASTANVTPLRALG